MTPGSDHAWFRTNYTVLPNNNLTNSWYRALDGPPLAPRGRDSRIVTQFRQRHGRDGQAWYVEGGWEDVLTVSGIPFLPFHFRGEGNLPIRDLAHVRPNLLAQARSALIVFARNIVGSGQ